MGIPIEQGTSISVEPDLDSSVQSEIEHDLQDEVVRNDHYYSLELYIEQECDVSEYEEQVKGLFGILTMKTMYRICRPQDAEREWQRDMDEAWKSNCSYVERKINSVIERFMQSLTSAANDRKAALEKQLNAYLDDMKPDGNVEIYQQALEYIVQLQKEVSQ